MKRIYKWSRKAVDIIAFLFMICMIIALILLLMEMIAMIVCHIAGVGFNPWPTVVWLITILIIDAVVIGLRVRAVYGGFCEAVKALIKELSED